MNGIQRSSEGISPDKGPLVPPPTPPPTYDVYCSLHLYLYSGTVERQFDQRTGKIWSQQQGF